MSTLDKSQKKKKKEIEGIVLNPIFNMNMNSIPFVAYRAEAHK